jgi:glycosyltransferase involved in cell wall biosynthesis
MIKISVIVPTYNEEKNIRSCMKSLSNQTLPREEYEIIVVDYKSMDRTVEIAKKYADRVIQQKSKGVGGARNDGARIAKGEILATTDADTLLPKDWLERILKDFEKKTVVCVYGYLIPGKNNGIYKLLFRSLNWGFFLGTKLELYDNICAANAAFRKKQYMEVGGFLDMPVFDDIEISIRMRKRGRIVFDRHLPVVFSLRRIEKSGLMNFALFSLRNLLHFITEDKEKLYRITGYSQQKY